MSSAIYSKWDITSSARSAKDAARPGRAKVRAIADHSSFEDGIPDAYHIDLGPLLFEPFAVDVAARVARIKPRKIVEVAAGTGIVTRRLLEVLLPESTLTATDLKEPMLARARQYVGADARVAWRQADAQNLPFGDREFDALVCQFGLMFFPDKPMALREFHRVLEPGGRLLLNTWDSFANNPRALLVHTFIRESLPDDPPAFYEVPFGLHDVNTITALVTDAGFADVKIETIELAGEAPSAAAAARGFVRGNPVVAAIVERGVEHLEIIEAELARKLAARFGDNPLRLPLRAHVVTATR